MRLRQGAHLLRGQCKGVFGGGVDGCGGERHGEGGAVVPSGPLVEEPGASWVAGFAEHEVEGGVVEVGEVGGEALGGAEGSADLLYGAGVSALRLYAGADGEADERAKDRGLR